MEHTLQTPPEISTLDRYRKFLVGLIRMKMPWCNLTFADIYVPTGCEYYRTDKKVASAPDQSPESLPEFHRNNNILHLLLDNIKTGKLSDMPTCIFNDPSNTRSQVYVHLAGNLAESDGFNPVLIPCRELNLQELFENASDIPESQKKFTGILDAFLMKQVGFNFEEFLSYPNVVLIFFNFDEIPFLTREKMGILMHCLAAVKKQLRNNSAVIITGRNSILKINDPLFLHGSHIIRILPYTDRQIQTFTDTWNRLTGDSFDGLRYISVPGSVFEQASRQPFFLALMARLHHDGYTYDPGDPRLSLADIFRDSVDIRCRITDEKLAVISGAELRVFLQAAGFATFIFHHHRFSTDEVRMVVKYIKSPPAGIRVAKFRHARDYAEDILLTIMPNNENETKQLEFTQEPFNEYCAAEFIAERIDTILQRVHAEPTYMDRRNVAHEWMALFSHAIIPPRIQTFLEPMLGCWESFIQGQHDENRRAEGLQRLFNLCGAMYQRIMLEKDEKEMTRYLEPFDLVLYQAFNNSIFNTLLLGSYCARELTKMGKKTYFNLEKWVPGLWWHMMLQFKHNYPDQSPEFFERFLKGVSMDNSGMIFLSGDFRPGLFLPYVRIPGISFSRNRINMISQEDGFTGVGEYPAPANVSTGIVLDRSVFDYGDLSCGDPSEYEFPPGAVQGDAVGFDSASLYGASFRYCNLMLATFYHCNLDTADFTGADLTEASLGFASLRHACFKKAQMIDTFLGNADCTGADFNSANLEDADLTGANLTGADLRGANLTGVRLKDSLFQNADLRGAALPEDRSGGDFSGALFE